MHTPPCRFAYKPGARMYAPGTLDGCMCEHDQFCPSSYTMACECHLIAEVRADERKRNGIPEPTVYDLARSSNPVVTPEHSVNTQTKELCKHVYEDWRGMSICIECGSPN